MYVYWFIKSPICSPKKNTSLFLKSPQGPKNKLLHFIELKSRNLPVESRTFFWNCAANSRIKHSSMSRPPTRSEVSLSTRSLPRTNSTMLTEKIEWPMEQNLQLMGEPKWVKKSLHTSLDYHQSLWLLGWPHLIVSLMAQHRNCRYWKPSQCPLKLIIGSWHWWMPSRLNPLTNQFNWSQRKTTITRITPIKSPFSHLSSHKFCLWITYLSLFRGSNLLQAFSAQQRHIHGFLWVKIIGTINAICQGGGGVFVHDP